MLTLKILRENPDYVAERLAIRNMDAGPVIKKILELDVRRRAAQTQSDALTAEQKKIAAGIGKLMKEGKKAEAEEIKKQAAQAKETIKELNQEQESLEKELDELLVTLPNIPYSLVVPGKGEDDNVLVREGGMVPDLSSGALPHWELAKKFDLIDFDLGVKLTGAGFPVYKGKGARLQMSLIQFFLDQNTRSGYKEIMPPIMVNEDSG